MNPKDKDLLRTKLSALSDEMTKRIVDIVDGLYERGTISKYMREDIVETYPTNRRKARELLILLPTRGSTAFADLYDVILEHQLFHAADILKPENAPHKSSVINPTSQTDEEEPDEDLPDSWPTDEALNSYKNLQKIEDKHVKIKKLYNTLIPKGQDLTYLMSAKPRGRVFAINNENFHKFASRDGAVQDRKVIEALFTDLDFYVHFARPDRTKQEMWECLVEEEKNIEHANASCFVLFIMSHGHEGVVFGVDGDLDEDRKPVNCVKIKDIVDLFARSKILAKKPKLLFIQACQGEGNRGIIADDVPSEHDTSIIDGAASGGAAADYVKDNVDNQKIAHYINLKNVSKEVKESSEPVPKEIEESSETLPKEIEESNETILKEIKESSEPVPKKIEEESSETVPKEVVGSSKSVPKVSIDSIFRDEPDARGDKIPFGADIYIAMATIPGQLSWLNTHYGTWFIQAIGYVFAKWAYKYDLNKLMTRVSNLVARAETERGKHKQMIETTSRLRKDFYFFPGLYEPNEQ